VAAASSTSDVELHGQIIANLLSPTETSVSRSSSHTMGVAALVSPRV